jgi:DNA-binding NarL/FixJ family response regulator
MTRKLKVLLVDDHPLVREWLTSLIDQQPDMGVCGEADGIADATKLLKNATPDIAVVDLSLKDASGLELVKSIKARWANVGIVVLSMHDEEVYAERAIRAGARGYVMKRESTKRIIAAIRDVSQGKLFVSDQISAAFAQALKSAHNQAPRKVICIYYNALFPELLTELGIFTRQERVDYPADSLDHFSQLDFPAMIFET